MKKLRLVVFCLLVCGHLVNWSFKIMAAEGDQQWYLSKMRVQDAWNISEGVSSVAVAILDSGVSLDTVSMSLMHDDLLNTNRIILGRNYSTYGSMWNVKDLYAAGHGTYIAGIIGGEEDGYGIVGINKNCVSRVYKVYQLGETVDPDSLIKAINHAAAYDNVKVINLSLHIDYDQNVANTIGDHSDILFVCAAGNSGNENVLFPASLAAICHYGDSICRAELLRLRDLIL